MSFDLNAITNDTNGKLSVISRNLSSLRQVFLDNASKFTSDIQSGYQFGEQVLQELEMVDGILRTLVVTADPNYSKLFDLNLSYTIGQGDVVFTWNAVPGANEYLISYRAYGSEDSWVEVYSDDMLTYSWTFTPGRWIFKFVVDYTGATPNEKPVYLEINIPGEVCVSPVLEYDTGVFTWPTVPDATSYTLRYRILESNDVFVEVGAGPETTYGPWTPPSGSWEFQAVAIQSGFEKAIFRLALEIE